MTTATVAPATTPAAASTLVPRLAGAAGRADAVARLGRRLLAGLPTGRVHPTTDHRALPLFVWTRMDGVLPPEWAVRGDGALAVIDGAVWMVRGGDATCAAILDRVMAEGIGALDAVSMDATVTVWDAAARTLWLARDRRGSTPLYVAEIDGAVAWSSDLPPLLRAGAARDIDPVAIDNFLADGFVPAPLTLVKAIRKVPAGCAVVVRDSRIIATERFARAPAREILDLDPDATTQAIDARMTAAVRSRTPASGPVGVLLSGGVDSKTIVAALVRRLGRDGDDVRTFTFRYAGYDGGWNEGGPAAETARHFGTRHREIEFPASAVADNFERMILSYGEPFTYGAHSFLLDAVREAGVTRVLTGAGADGWYRSRNERRARRIHDAGPLAVDALRAATASASFAAGLLSPVPGVNRYAEGLAWRLDELDWVARTGIPWRSGPSILPERMRRRLYAEPGWAATGAAAARALFDAVTADIPGARDDLRFPMVHLRCFVAEGAHQWYAACARAFGLRFDHPFFDDAMIDLLARLRRPDPDKAELRRFAATLMPDALAAAPKVPQTVPIRHWFRGPLRAFLCDGLARERLARHGVFRPAAVATMLDQHLSGAINHEWRLWAILAVTSWIDVVLEGTVTPA